MNLNALSVVHATDTLTKNASKIISPVMISEIVADRHQSDMTTASGTDAVSYTHLDEIYNLAAQSHVKVSFDVQMGIRDRWPPWQ